MKQTFPLLLLLSTLYAPRHAEAVATPWQSNPQGQVRLLSSYDVAPKKGALLLGLHFKTAPGWYVYWKEAGDAGYPPSVRWDGSRGFRNPELLWPQPARFVLPGDIVEYGYEGEVVYPVRAELAGAEDGVRAVATVSYLTCYTSCIPYKYTLSLKIPAADPPKIDPEIAPLVERFMAQVPPSGTPDETILRAAKTVQKTPVTAEFEEQGRQALAWPPLMFLAFVGGLLLNVMPCVLPVLSIKLLGLVQQAGDARRAIVRNSLLSAAGIVASFLGLGGIAAAAREGGRAVGWGIQFQNPVFVMFLAVVVLLFALNLWGVFEVGMPRIFGHFAATYGRGETLLAHFMSGLFATLLATPCSAPFLGTAMGFALTQSAGMIFMAFGAAGAGMAFPYFLLAAFPSTLHWLPKPGAWMVRLRAFFGVLLAGTAVWLGWVLYQQLKSPHPPLSLGERVQGEGGLTWVAFDESEILRYIKEGKPVFVDVTADWCVTCKYNERFVLSDPEVAEAFLKRGVVMMRADWTQRDAEIERYLKKFSRAGIPFYALYYPYRDPVILSEFLTKKQVLRELRAWDALGM